MQKSQKNKMSLISRIRKWMIISKVWSFQTVFIAVTTGSILALKSFNIEFYLAMLIGVVSLNAIANIYNDIHDFKVGIDKENDAAVIERKHPMFKNSETYTPERMLKLSVFILLVISISCGIYIAIFRGIFVLFLGTLGALMAFSYTLGKSRLKLPGYGEIMTFLVYGPLLVCSSFYVNSGYFSLVSLFASIPIGIMIMLILFANNIRDIEADKQAGLVTLANTLGAKKSLMLFEIFIIAAYMFSFANIIFIGLSALFTILSFPFVWHILKVFHKSIPPNAAAMTSKVALLFGILFALGMLF
ncbi:MAG: prenyltransferase [Candidatus Micrarchaeaceae archaeon]